MEKHVISSFSGLHKVLTKYNSRVYLFRGVSDAKHQLIPKIGRTTSHIYDDLFQYEDALMSRFKKIAIPHLATIPENEWEWLAIAQHHGLPTRLLDWTRNPIVATFFAVNSLHNGDSAIYVLDSSALDHHIDYNFEPYVYDNDNKEVRVFEPDHITRRIIVQNGLFTVHNNPRIPFINGNLKKVIIKKNCRNDLKKVLDGYGINKANLFPGLDGISEYLDWYTTYK